ASLQSSPVLSKHWNGSSLLLTNESSSSVGGRTLLLVSNSPERKDVSMLGSKSRGSQHSVSLQRDAATHPWMPSRARPSWPARKSTGPSHESPALALGSA